MASVSKRPRRKADGSNGDKWIVRYLDGASHKQRSFDKKRDADALKLKLDNERAMGVVTPLRPTTIAQFHVEYARHIDRRLDDGQIKRGSHRNIADALRISILPRLGKLRLSELTPEQIEQWFIDIREQDGLSARTAIHRLSKLAGFLDYARQRRVISSDPDRIARKLIGGMPETPIRTFTVSEVQALLAASKVRRLNQHATTQTMVAAIVHVATLCGLRLGEILALDLSSVDFTARRIHVSKTLDQWDTLTAPKTKAAVRFVPMPGPVADLLRQWIDVHYVDNPRKLIFRRNSQARGYRDAPVSGRHFGLCYFWPLCDAAGLPADDQRKRFHFHALRHFAGSWWLDQGMPLTTVSRLLGHANPSVTMKVYAHSLMTAEARHGAVDTMASALLSH